MLTKIELTNFKSHKKTALDLDKSGFNAIVGQNSTGKTTILQAAHYMSQLVRQPFSKIFDYERDPEFLATSGEQTSKVSINGYFGHAPQHKQNWSAVFDWKRGHEGRWSPNICWETHESSDENYGWSASLNDAPSQIRQSIGYAVYLKLEARNLARKEYSDEITPRVNFDGSGLAPTLDYLRGEDPDAFKRLAEMLRKVVPSVRTIDVRRAKVEILRERTIEVDGRAIPYEERRQVTGQEVVLDMASGQRIPGHAISEGTMLTLGLLTILFGPGTPKLILLDDIEQGLHPQAQRQLVQLLKELVDQTPNLQVLFTTHSPYVIDELVPSQVHVLHLDEYGYTLASRLDKHPNADWATDALTTGEFWDAEGEEWVSQELSGA